MRCVVLEPNGEHWVIELPPDKVGQFFSQAEPIDWDYNPRHGRIPVYKQVQYVGHQFLDNHGNCYWIYVREK